MPKSRRKRKKIHEANKKAKHQIIPEKKQEIGITVMYDDVPIPMRKSEEKLWNTLTPKEKDRHKANISKLIEKGELIVVEENGTKYAVPKEHVRMVNVQLGEMKMEATIRDIKSAKKKDNADN